MGLWKCLFISWLRLTRTKRLSMTERKISHFRNSKKENFMVSMSCRGSTGKPGYTSTGRIKQGIHLDKTHYIQLNPPCCRKTGILREIWLPVTADRLGLKKALWWSHQMITKAWWIHNFINRLLIFVQDFIYVDIPFVHWYLLAQLLFEGQGDGVGLPFGMVHAALQVGIVEALPPAQTVTTFVKTKSWHKDKVESACK